MGADKRMSRAVVIGGSIAGLLAARVLSDHFDQVTILDRDQFPDEPGFRSGVPQSRHIHVLLPRGRRLLENLLPGLSTALKDAGAGFVQWPRDVLWLTRAGWSERYDHDVDLGILGANRDTIEWHIRQRVLAIDGIELVESRNVTGVLTDPKGVRITGVTHVLRGAGPDQSNEPEDLPADLVVDASGRNSRTPRWLAELGYEAPDESKVNSHVAYASRLYTKVGDPEQDWKMQFLQPSPPDDVRGGAMLQVDGSRWIVSLQGTDDVPPPTDDEGYLEFARSLRVPTFYEAIKDAEPLSPVYGYRRTENQLRRYDRLERFPEQFVVIGDAACAFNPIYGQGMSIAALQATTLDTVLTEQRRSSGNGDLTGVSRRFRRAVASNIADAWLLATSDDLRYPKIEGAEASFSTRMMHRYLDRAIRAATGDPQLNQVLTEVFTMMRRPKSLFRPNIVFRAMTGSGRQSGAAPYQSLRQRRESM